MATSVKFKVKAHVTVELLKIADNGTPSYVTITGAIFQAKTNEAEQKKYELAFKRYQEALAKPDDFENGQAPTPPQAPNPPKLAHVVNLETGQVQQIIVGSVLESELKTAYPEDAYVGLSFEIKKMKASNNKRYAMYQIAEIEVEGEQAQAAPVAGTKKAKAS